MFKNTVNIEVTVFSREVPIPNQTFNFKFYLQDSHFFSSCAVLPRLAFVFKLTCIDKVNICFQVVIYKLFFTSWYKLYSQVVIHFQCIMYVVSMYQMYQCITYTSNVSCMCSCISTFGNDVALRKIRVESVVIYYLCGFKGGKMKRSTATGKNGKFVIIIFTCACRVL